MNLFDSITGKSSVQGFFWNNQPETPSFAPINQPVAPRTQSYQQPMPTATVKSPPLFAQPQVKSIIPQVNAWEQLVSDDEIEQMIKSWASDDEILMVVSQLEKERQSPQVSQDIAQPPKQTSVEDYKMKSSENFWLWENTKDLWKFFANVPADSAQVLWGFYDAVRHPINTTTGIIKVWQWLSDKAVYSIANSISSALGGKEVPPTQNAQMIDALWTHIKETYWTAWKFKKAIVENPADTLLTLMWWLWVVSKVAEANNMTNVVNNINKIQEVINPINILKNEAKIVASPVTKFIPSILWKTTGTSAETITTAFKQWGTPEFQSALRWQTTPQNILSNAQEWMQAIKNDRATAYWADYAKLQANKTPIIIDDVVKNFTKSLIDEYKIRVSKNWLDFSQSKITGGTSQSQIESMYKDLINWKDKTPEGLDILKQRLQDYYRWTPDSSKWDRLSTIASNAVKSKISENVPEYANMTATYEKLTNDIRDITKTLSLWDKTQAQTAITKLSSVLRDNFSARQDMVKLIEQYSGKNLQWQIAWASLNPLAAKWLAWVITGGGVIFWQLANPAFWWWLALASPRLIWEIANTIWYPVEKVKSAINFLKNANPSVNSVMNTVEWVSKKITPKNISKVVAPTIIFPKKNNP